MEAVDQRDREILCELDRDSRISYSKLGERIRMSHESVRYRVLRLIDRQVINKFCTVVDASKLGFVYHKVFLKLRNVNEESIERIINRLEDDPFVTWAVRTEGKYDIGFAVKVATPGDVLELGNLVESLARDFDCFIGRRVFCTNLVGEYLTRDYLVHRKRSKAKSGFYSAGSLPLKLDETSLQIVRLLAKNARYSAVELSEHLPLSPDAVLHRMKKLERDKVITRYNLVLNHHTLQQMHFKVFIYLNQISSEQQNAFYAKCKTNPHVVFVLKTLAEWDLELDVEVPDFSTYRCVMLELTNDYASIIKDYESLLVSRIYKYTLFT